MSVVQNVGRWEINTGKHMLIDGRTAVIQITDTDLDFPTIKGCPARTLGLRFLDVEDGDHGAMKHHAEEIASLIKMTKLKDWSLLVHCEMGVSRSGAVAQAAIEYCFEEAVGSIPRNPNMRLLSLLRQELGLPHEPV